MNIALCNEVIRELEFPAQCGFAAALGYDAIELAPFTLGPEPHLMGAGERARLRRAAADAGIAISSLHWLLVVPKGLSIHTPDDALRARTIEVMRRLIGLCADLGGTAMVHGSPMARRIPDGADAAEYRARALDTFAAVAADAEAAGVAYCIEPLAARETNFVNTVAEAAAMVEAIGSPALRTMIDTCAAAQAEALPVAELIDRWLPTGLIGHIQVNDRDQSGPGQGADSFAPAFAALRRNHYRGTVAVEPFVYFPDGPAAAARAIGYIRGILEALDWRDQ
ncbi:MAG TPA: TIM barrel protein [Alphaproteobacteria bacterium]